MVKSRSLHQARNSRRLERIRGGSPRHEVLRAASVGAVVLGAMVLGATPASPYMWKHFVRAADRRAEQARRNKLRRAIEKLERRRFVRLVQDGERMRLEITEDGERALRDADVRAVQLPRPKRWDKKWRIVFFDVPEEKKDARDALRRLLVNVGFYPLQKSVFVTPAPCAREVRMIAEYFRLEHDVLLCETAHLGEAEPTVRAHFGLRG